MTHPEDGTAAELSGSQQAIWSATLGIYQGFLAGDRTRIDAYLHPDATFWDSEEAEMIVGRAELDRARDRRPVGQHGPTVTALDASDPVIDVWGETALARHWLTVRFGDSPSAESVRAPESGRAPESVRVTTVWRLTDGKWLAVHNHEDVRTAPR